jgi:hypothetical protein
MSKMAIFDLCAQAGIELNAETAFHGLLNPYPSAVCLTAQI